jgi:hypothetical protein
LFRFFAFRRRGRKAAAAPQNREAYAEALLAGWVPPPEGAPEAHSEPAKAEAQDDAVLERFYQNQQ